MKTTVICTSCAVFHKSVFDQVGLFDPNIKSGEDTDMWIRIGLVYPVVFHWNLLARYVYDAKSLSKRKEYLNQKMDFTKFDAAQKANPKLKKFLDLNLFSFAIQSKLNHDFSNFKRHFQRIDLKNLSFKKRILLRLPAFMLAFLVKFNLFLVGLGLRKSAF